MKYIFYTLFFAFLIFAVIRFVPTEAKHRALAAIGLDQVVTKSIPHYLGGRLGIADNPVTKREKLLKTLANDLSDLKKHAALLGAIEGSGTTTSRGAAGEISAMKSLLKKSETTLGELEASNQEVGVLRAIGDRVINGLLPPASTTCPLP